MKEIQANKRKEYKSSWFPIYLRNVSYYFTNLILKTIKIHIKYLLFYYFMVQYRKANIRYKTKYIFCAEKK